MTNKPMQIVLADDDEDDRLFFSDAIDEIKMNTITKLFNDGVELMNYLTQVDVILPHIIFLDLNMPKKNGMECLEDIRNNANLKDLVIAIYSTSASEIDIENTFVHGANVYINKPTDFSKLKSLLREVLSTNWQFHTSGLNKDTFLLSI
ncbi:MAG: response regulator [Chitinophagales bacterium]|nr:response regulator [Chitinophagales bacterium]